MKLNLLVIAAALGATSAMSLGKRRQNSGGNGPYGPGASSTESSLASHTIYMPSNPGNASLPVVVWGNGGCGSDGTSNSALLQQIASYGYLAIASGAPGQQGSTTSKMMTDSIDWAVANAGKGRYAHVDATKIMAAGFSCGGIEAYDQIWDHRVATIGIFSSGLLTNQTAAQYYTKPILYCLGGSSDIAYQNVSLRCFHVPSDVFMCRRMPVLPGIEKTANTPSWKGNLNVGHGGTLFDANGGLFGKAGRAVTRPMDGKLKHMR